MRIPDLKHAHTTEEMAEVIRHAFRTGDDLLLLDALFNTWHPLLSPLVNALGRQTWEKACDQVRPLYRKQEINRIVGNYKETLGELGEKLEGLEGKQKYFVEKFILLIEEFLNILNLQDKLPPKFHITEKEKGLSIVWFSGKLRLEFLFGSKVSCSWWSFFNEGTNKSGTLDLEETRGIEKAYILLNKMLK